MARHHHLVHYHEDSAREAASALSRATTITSSRFLYHHDRESATWDGAMPGSTTNSGRGEAQWKPEGSKGQKNEPKSHGNVVR